MLINYKKNLKYFFLCTFLLQTQPVFAYLDPGSGSALVAFLATLLGSIWFSILSLFYKVKESLIPKGKAISENDIVFFSEGRAYWSSFRPLIEELIEKKIHFRYLTLDMYDPALEIDNKYMKSKRLSLKPGSLSRINNIKAKCVVSTTPNIGTKGFPIKKSPFVKNLIHFFHHIGDVSIYKKNSLDYYDTVILGGEFQRKSIEELEVYRGLKQKDLIVLGFPYLDSLSKEKIESTKINPFKKKDKTILVGSSWGAKGCLRKYGISFINQLAEYGFKVIVRPHPHSLIAELDFIIKCEEQTTHSNVSWDKSHSPSSSMLYSDILISDTSSLRFDYAFLYEKPVITLDIPIKSLSEFEAADLKESWFTGASKKLGQVVDQTSISEICVIVEGILSAQKKSDIKEFKRNTVHNFGISANAIISYVEKLSKENK
tara:strand:+ start:2010 stop:3299 length:1290 start_codon:yes stop_codon:yes gene_type:complete